MPLRSLDIHEVKVDLINAPRYIDVAVLVATVASDYTVPADAKYVIFTKTEDFWACYTDTATIPVADVVDGTGSELNPTIRDITDVATISLISEADGLVSMAFYS
jgi:hypothetical protein